MLRAVLKQRMDEIDRRLDGVWCDPTNIYHGTFLEQIVRRALILSSHAGGLAGQQFGEWLPHLLRELSARYGKRPPPVSFSGDLRWPEFEAVEIPFASTTAADWNDALYDYFAENLFLVNDEHTGARDQMVLRAHGSMGIVFSELVDGSKDYLLSFYKGTYYFK